MRCLMPISAEKEIVIKYRKLNRSEKKEVRDFIDFLCLKNHLANEQSLLSESILAKDWLKPEEDEAWKICKR